MVIIAKRCWHLQNQMVILQGVLKAKFTKYCTCEAKNPGELPELSRQWTGFFTIVELEPYMLEAYLGNKFVYGFLMFSQQFKGHFDGYLIAIWS